jgi:hypothetical protein
MLIHASRRGKMSVNAHLWPYAVRMASDQVNNLPRMQSADKRTPLQAFANTDVHTNLKHWHPFGSPVYVLENDLQTQGIFGKWKSRSKLGIYLGKSPQHSRNVALVLNRETGHVSPQFHVKHDHCYHTVRDEQQKSPDLWMIKAGFVGAKELVEAAPTKGVRRRKAPNDPSARGWKRPRMAGEATDHQTEGAASSEGAAAPEGAPAEGATGAPSWYANHRQSSSSSSRSNNDSHGSAIENSEQQNESTGANVAETEGSREPDGVEMSQHAPTSTRSGRTVNPPARLIQALMVMATMVGFKNNGSVIEGEIFCLKALFLDGKTGNEDPLCVLKATSDPDTMYLHEAMQEPDKEQFKEAMVKEVKDQMDNGNFIVVERSAVPDNELIMPTVWQMKRKRDIITRAIKKWKVRLNIDGSKMIQGTHYEESYLPVATWNSI